MKAVGLFFIAIFGSAACTPAKPCDPTLELGGGQGRQSVNLPASQCGPPFDDVPRWTSDPRPWWPSPGADAGSPTILPAPELPEVEHPAAPAISGGSVYTTIDGTYVVIGDSDRDRVWVVNAEDFTLRHEVVLESGDEPGRVAEDGDGLVHVVLRRSGMLVTIKPSNGAIVDRRRVCPSPRGVAYDSRGDAMRVVCSGGELVTVPLHGGEVTTTQIADDLRDIVIRERDIAISTFRSARILFFDRELHPIGTFETANNPRVPERMNTFWRMIAQADGALVVTAQSSASTILQPVVGGYSVDPLLSDCIGTVNTVVMRLTGPMAQPEFLFSSMLMPLATDLVEIGPRLWVVSAANRGDRVRGGADGFAQVALAQLNGCAVTRAPISAGYTVTGGSRVGSRAVFFSRQPAGLLRSDGQALWFANALSVENTGHRVFHGNFNNQTGLACASCHPEGGDDGLTWNFSLGNFRTPSLRGTIGGTAPYHWTGEFVGLSALVRDVFSGRMRGPMLDANRTAQLESWLKELPPPPEPQATPAQRESIARGDALFRSAQTDCASCHSGPRYTNNQTTDVGTGGRFQVPSLIGLRYRAPYMHNGCASSIDVRLSSMACGGSAHGMVGLVAQERADLAAFLLSI